VICKECKAAGKRSKVFEEGCTTTLVHCPPFYDEEGKRHVHDVNTSTVGYQCSNGHHWSGNVPKVPCWCGWPEARALEVVDG
jgi:hypothetical protein